MTLSTPIHRPEMRSPKKNRLPVWEPVCGKSFFEQSNNEHPQPSHRRIRGFHNGRQAAAYSREERPSAGGRKTAGKGKAFSEIIPVNTNAIRQTVERVKTCDSWIIQGRPHSFSPPDRNNICLLRRIPAAQEGNTLCRRYHYPIRFCSGNDLGFTLCQ